MRKLARIVEALQPDTAHVKVEGDLPASFELHAEAEGVETSLPSFETEGSAHETPSRFESSGELRLGRLGTAMVRDDEYHELRLVERDGEDSTRRYAVEGSHRLPASSTTAAVVSSADEVSELVDFFLSSFSERIGDAVDAEVVTHQCRTDGEGSTAAFESDYTFRLIGLDRLATDSYGRMSVEEAELTVSRGTHGGLVFSWDFDLRNHGSLFAEALYESGVDAHRLVTARRSAKFSESFEWSARSDADTDTASLEASYDTENASRYAERLRERGFVTPAGTSLSLQLGTHGSTKAVSFDYETDGDLDAETGEKLYGWTGFLPLPVALVFVRLLSP